MVFSPVMAKDEGGGRCVFPLTSLQIGDLQSYLSHLSLFLASESGKFYILVDNRPWLKDLVSRSTHWWQLMVTKSRLSPFANTRGRKEKTTMEELSDLQASCSTDARKSSTFRKLFYFIDAVMLSRNRALLPVKKLRNSLIANSKLHRTLYGFIVFEVAWSDVRGISYFNELQTDTSLAIEAKIMRRWEFDCISQAAKSISSWYPGTFNEQILLKEHLDTSLGEIYHDAQENLHDADIITDDIITEENICNNEAVEQFLLTSNASNSEETLEATLYRDVLILFRFNDHDLPFKLKEIIMSKLWLLTLLEAGLPSWVIFLQSYPGFSRLYKPWMCPLARASYVLISVITVLIGFYDLYKNVPLLKVTLSNLFGPLFEWIEAWEMISRIKYLGTMLFLHNCQKAVRWFLSVTRTVVSIVSFSVGPILRPLSEFLDCFFPAWSAFLRIAESSFTAIGDILEILILPIWYVVVVAWNVATSFVYPVLWVLLYTPFRLLHGFCSIASFLCAFIYDLGGDVWVSAKSIFQLAKSVDSTVAVSTYEVSMWRSLWDDLFSHVFRALRSILNGFVAFFIACNRHRLSIYNHAEEFTRRSLQATKNARRRREISHNGGNNNCNSLERVPSTDKDHED
ncbi:hypothetical protein ACP275_13G015300 [Erythranthe tilingii]